MGIYTGKAADTMTKGRALDVNDMTFVVPELVLGDREELEDSGVLDDLDEAWETIDQNKQTPGTFSKDKSKALRRANIDSAKCLAKIVTRALKLNYPEITEEFVGTHFSMTQLGEAYMHATGIKPKGEAAGSTAGEA